MIDFYCTQSYKIFRYNISLSAKIFSKIDRKNAGKPSDGRMATCQSDRQDVPVCIDCTSRRESSQTGDLKNRCI